MITMGNSPKPAAWILEKSDNFGRTYKPWQYFADSLDECVRLFGADVKKERTRDDSVICETEYSQIVPLENGEVRIYTQIYNIIEIIIITIIILNS